MNQCTMVSIQGTMSLFLSFCLIPCVTCIVSCVRCKMSCVPCLVWRIRCHVYFFLLHLFQSSGANQWRVCYQRGLLRLVPKGRSAKQTKTYSGYADCSHIWFSNVSSKYSNIRHENLCPLFVLRV